MDKIHHIAIPVKAIDKAVEWYVSQFDVRVSYQDESWALLKFENLSLALVLPSQHPGHFAIEHDRAERFGALTPHRDGTESVYIKDPSGNTVEILKTNQGTSA